jgi:hypothetical protein
MQRVRWNIAEQCIMQEDLAAQLPALQNHTTRTIALLVRESFLPRVALKAYRHANKETEV